MSFTYSTFVTIKFDNATADPDLLQRLSVALGHRPSPSQLSSDDYFVLIRQMLDHVLEGDMTYSVSHAVSEPDRAQEARLNKLYQGQKSKALIARVEQVSQDQLTPELIHQFYASLVGLRVDGLGNDAVSRQLKNYLGNDITPFWDPTVVLGEGDYDQLGNLLDNVPEDLRWWLLQFCRGGHRTGLAEWMSMVPDSLLFRGLRLAEKSEPEERALSAFSRALERLFQPHWEVEDIALSGSLDRVLSSPAAWETVFTYLRRLSDEAVRPAALDLDLTLHISVATRRRFFQRLASYALTPPDSTWLGNALQAARQAPGMKALSLGIALRKRYGSIEREQVLLMASLLLSPQDLSDAADMHALPVWQELLPQFPHFRRQPLAFLDAEQLFEILGIDLLCEGRGACRQLRYTAHQTWLILAQTAGFHAWIRPLLEHLNWYGAAPDQISSPRIVQALAGQAVVDFNLRTFNGDPTAAEECSGSVNQELSHLDLMSRLRADIIERKGDLPAPLIDLMLYLTLRDVAAELLIEDTPDFLIYGRSLQSVALIQSVSLLESASRYASIDMAYNDLVGITAQAVVAGQDGEAVDELRELSQIRPALLYAASHGHISLSENHISTASATQIQQAVGYLNTQRTQHAEAIAGLLAISVPDRGEMADRLLERAGVTQTVSSKSLSAEDFSALGYYGLQLARTYTLDRIAGMITGNREPTLRELVMMGEIYREAEPDIPTAYDKTFDQYREQWVACHVPLIKRLLCEMPPPWLRLLSHSTVEISRVSFEEGGEADFGVFLRCRPGLHVTGFENADAARDRYFEIIPASGVARKVRQQFADVRNDDRPFLGGNIVESVVILQDQAARKALARVSPLLDMDSDGYVSGTVSRSAKRLNHPAKGKLIPAPMPVYMPGVLPADIDMLAGKIAEHLHGHRFLVEAVSQRHTTPWETTWEKERHILDVALRLILPFYGCVKDLSEGSRSAGTIIGCALDVVFALIPLGQFAASTARIARIAGRLTVEATVTEMTGAVKTLLIGLASQSGVVGAYHLLKLGVKLGRIGLRALVNAVPHLERSLKISALNGPEFLLRDGAYQASTTAEAVPDGVRLASVDGAEGVVVARFAAESEPQVRLMDPHDLRPYGPKLFGNVSAEPFNLARASELARGVKVVPAAEIEQGIYRIEHAHNASPVVIERKPGVYDVLSDDQSYRLDTHEPSPMLKAQSLAPLSEESKILEPEQILCRLTRALDLEICEDGLMMINHPPAVTDQQEAGLLGRYASSAFQAREYKLMKVTRPGRGYAPAKDFNVWVHEGKITQGSARTNGALPLSANELRALGLPSAVQYRQTVTGQFARADWRLPPQALDADARIQAPLPAVSLGAIAEGIDDQRTLRAVRLPGGDVVVEADRNVFYKAVSPQDGSAGLTFEKLDPGRDTDLLDAYLLNAEQYRFVGERSGALQDRENIARLLFDLNPKPGWLEPGRWAEVRSYDAYVTLCKAQGEPNVLLKAAENVLSLEQAQADFVRLAKESIPDYRSLAASSAAEREEVATVLNRLLPVQEATSPWSELSAATITLPESVSSVQAQLNRANLAYAIVQTEDGKEIVYYALSGGRQARQLRLRLDVAGAPDALIDAIPHIDARTRMQDVTPDPSFTSLPVVRRPDDLNLRSFDRYVDSERLIASVLRRDLAGTRPRSIRFFTLLDTCRSCGGLVLPRLKLDFPSASFSVRYLKEYAGA